MRTIIGTTRSGRSIEVETAPPAALLPDNAVSDEVFDVFCAITYLYVRERQGWRLMTDGDRMFRDILANIELSPTFRSAFDESRRQDPDRTVADDIAAGRNFVLSALRA